MRYQHQYYLHFLLIVSFLLATHIGCGCTKTVSDGPESPQPKELAAEPKVVNDQKISESVTDDAAFDTASIMKVTGEAMLAHNYEKALELFAKAIDEYDKKESSDTETLTTFLLDITYCHVMLGDDEKGIPYIERACQLMPENPSLLGTSASLFLRLERYDEAIERFLKAIELQQKTNPYFFSPEEQSFYSALFAAYNIKGDLRSAYDVYKTIKSRLDGYQFHVEPTIKDLIQYFKSINDDNWESMPRFRIVKKLPPHPQEEKIAVNSEDNSRVMNLSIRFYTELIDDAPK